MKLRTVSRVNLGAFAIVVFLCFAVPSCILFDPYPTCPTAFEGENALNKYETLRKSLTVSAITFFNEKIYLSTSGAILELTGERLDRLYKCRRADWDEFDEVGVDRVSGNLWFYDHRGLRLVRFDGDNWSSQEFPELPEPEYYSREDVNVGFDGFSYNDEFVLLNKHRFTLPNVTRAWIHEGDRNWKAFQFPDMGCRLENSIRSVENGCLKEIGIVGNELCAVLIADSIGKSISEGRPVHEDFSRQTDIVACKRDNSWRVVNLKGTPDFFVDKVVSRNNTMYATTRTGKIFRITTAGPEPVLTLGEVETFAISSEGNLLVWFSGQGIYEFRGEWKKLYDVPFEPGTDLRGSLIEENDGTIVVVASPPLDPDRRTKPPPDRVWILKKGGVIQIL
ncbi:MAG: hypothetical protein IPM25_04345 [Chloracidobacterium sp.]|nr:hypothetical protein [Chloracidobacterium sp.]